MWTYFRSYVEPVSRMLAKLNILQFGVWEFGFARRTQISGEMNRFSCKKSKKKKKKKNCISDFKQNKISN